jgi:5,10-methylenetetrahydromethanopterin reductase
VSGTVLGVALPLDRPVREVLDAAEAAEGLGFGSVWVSDDRLQRDPFSVLAALALRTHRVSLGPGVTNPYTRHPALLASAVATLDELSRGRAVLGLGAGGTSHAMLAVERTAPAATLRQAILLVRTLLSGGEATARGPVVRADRARLDFQPVRPTVPIYVGGRGPRVLALAGELADGVIVGNLATPGDWRRALEWVETGARRSGRDLRSVKLVAWLWCAVDDDDRSTVDAVRPVIATSLATSRPVLRRLRVELPPAFVRAMEAHRWSPTARAVAEAGRHLPDEVVHRFALAGTPARCRAKLEILLEAVPAMAQVVIVPLSPPGGSPADVVRRVATEVAPDLLAGPTRGGERRGAGGAVAGT